MIRGPLLDSKIEHVPSLILSKFTAEAFAIWQTLFDFSFRQQQSCVKCSGLLRMYSVTFNEDERIV